MPGFRKKSRRNRSNRRNVKKRQSRRNRTNGGRRYRQRAGATPLTVDLGELKGKYDDMLTSSGIQTTDLKDMLEKKIEEIKKKIDEVTTDDQAQKYEVYLPKFTNDIVNPITTAETTKGGPLSDSAVTNPLEQKINGVDVNTIAAAVPAPTTNPSESGAGGTDAETDESGTPTGSVNVEINGFKVTMTVNNDKQYEATKNSDGTINVKPLNASGPSDDGGVEESKDEAAATDGAAAAPADVST